MFTSPSVPKWQSGKTTGRYHKQVIDTQAGCGTVPSPGGPTSPPGQVLSVTPGSTVCNCDHLRLSLKWEQPACQLSGIGFSRLT